VKGAQGGEVVGGVGSAYQVLNAIIEGPRTAEAVERELARARLTCVANVLLMCCYCVANVLLMCC
jgi:hypothetical protein